MDTNICTKSIKTKTGKIYTKFTVLVASGRKGEWIGKRTKRTSCFRSFALVIPSAWMIDKFSYITFAVGSTWATLLVSATPSTSQPQTLDFPYPAIYFSLSLYHLPPSNIQLLFIFCFAWAEGRNLCVLHIFIPSAQNKSQKRFN